MTYKFSYTAIDAWRAEAMIKYIKSHLDYPKEKLEKICDNYLKFIKKCSYTVHEQKEN